MGGLSEQLQKIRAEAEEREAARKAAKAGVSHLDVTATPVKVDALKLIPESVARENKIAVFEFRKPDLGIAVFDPDAPGVKRLIDGFKAQGFNPKIFIASLRGLEYVWGFYRFIQSEKAPITSRVNIEKARILALTEELATVPKVANAITAFNPHESSVTEFLEIVLAGALAHRSSDIHFEPEASRVKLRYRIDGALYDISTDVKPDFYPSVVSRIKLLSNLKINIQDHPQDGRFTIGLAAKEIEIRVAIAPSEFGEIIVMRVLDPDVINLTLADLGFRNDDLEIITHELKRPHGMILNTGPTGSGKTSTLYAFLKAKYTSEIKIITIEDPIEYHLSGIEQTQVNEEAGYTFANGLRSIMRQDPDAILVGEVRDAEIAVQAALTGHIVFSTVHANEAAGAIPRLADLGVKATSMESALNLIIGQRLVRRLCEACKKTSAPDGALAENIKKFVGQLPARVNKEPFQNINLYKPVGCEKCGGKGYRGRIAIFELLVNDPEYAAVGGNSEKESKTTRATLEQLIEKGAGETEIRAWARSEGMVAMQEDGILKAITGITTIAEVEEATGPISWLRAH